MHVFVKNNYAGDVMDVCVLHNIENTFGIYLRLEGFIETNSYKYRHLTCPYFFTVTENTIDNDMTAVEHDVKIRLSKLKVKNKGNEISKSNFKFFSKFYIKLPEKILPSLKSNNFSVTYSIELITLQARKKRTFKCPLIVINSNFNCETDIEITDFNNMEYYEKKKMAVEMLNSQFNDKLAEEAAQTELNEENFLLSAADSEVFLINSHRIKKCTENSAEHLENQETVEIVKNLKYEHVDFNIEEVNEKNLQNYLQRVDLIKNTPVFRNPRIFNLEGKKRVIKIQGKEEIKGKLSFLAFIFLPTVFLSQGNLKIVYKKEIISTTLTVIKQDYENNQLIDVTIIKSEYFYSKNCLERVFEVEFEEFSLKCDKFEIKYVVILALDDYEVTFCLEVINDRCLIQIE
ncbi:hypothetical protein NUSPORA_02539 [Nucleospora cyclopteri]